MTPAEGESAGMSATSEDDRNPEFAGNALVGRFGHPNSNAVYAFVQQPPGGQYPVQVGGLEVVDLDAGVSFVFIGQAGKQRIALALGIRLGPQGRQTTGAAQGCAGQLLVQAQGKASAALAFEVYYLDDIEGFSKVQVCTADEALDRMFKK